MSQFPQDKYNTPAVPKSGGGSGMSAGVESGLSSVESVSGPEPEQRDKGVNFNVHRDTGAAGSKGGKSFNWDPKPRG